MSKGKVSTFIVLAREYFSIKKKYEKNIQPSDTRNEKRAVKKKS